MLDHEHPATFHRRSYALVRQFRAGDQEAIGAILAEVYASPDPYTVPATMMSLVEMASRVLTEFADDPDAYLEAALLHLASVEGDESPR
jgi:hypothetical protein